MIRRGCIGCLGYRCAGLAHSVLVGIFHLRSIGYLGYRWDPDTYRSLVNICARLRIGCLGYMRGYTGRRCSVLRFCIGHWLDRVLAVGESRSHLDRSRPFCNRCPFCNCRVEEQRRSHLGRSYQWGNLCLRYRIGGERVRKNHFCRSRRFGNRYPVYKMLGVGLHRGHLRIFRLDYIGYLGCMCARPAHNALGCRFLRVGIGYFGCNSGRGTCRNFGGICVRLSNQRLVCNWGCIFRRYIFRWIYTGQRNDRMWGEQERSSHIGRFRPQFCSRYPFCNCRVGVDCKVRLDIPDRMDSRYLGYRVLEG